jgi:hypothetical protein
MIIYNYDEITKEYIGQCNADLDPEETKRQGKNVYLIPANATTKKPPKAKENEIVIYNEGWEIVADFRGLYMVNSDMQPKKVEGIGELPEGYAIATEEQAQKILEDDLFYIVQDGVLIQNPNYEQQKADRREADFNKSFFNTSLGYIRRSVTMADGGHKDFLSDLLPIISMGVQSGQAINILAYDKPPFTEDVEDWTQYQHQVVVTAQFIQECFLQLSNDFLPINKE